MQSEWIKNFSKIFVRFHRNVDTKGNNSFYDGNSFYPTIEPIAKLNSLNSVKHWHFLHFVAISTDITINLFHFWDHNTYKYLGKDWLSDAILCYYSNAVLICLSHGDCKLLLLDFPKVHSLLRLPARLKGFPRKINIYYLLLFELLIYIHCNLYNPNMHF